jgi:DNA-binding SARP family transcriptional activator
MPNAVRIQLLGAAAAWRGDERLLFKTRKTLAVLAYLAAGAAPRRRQELAAFFWPSHDADRARASLRTTLGYLRQALADSAHGALATTRDSISLSTSHLLSVDIHTLDQTRILAARVASAPGLTAQLERAADAYYGPFLADLTLPEVPDFDEWAQGQRARWLTALSTVLDRLSALQKADGNLGAALGTLERWVEIDPGAEVAWQRLIRTRLECGDTAGARQAWESCREALADLEVHPGGEILALGTRIPVVRGTASARTAGSLLPPAGATPAEVLRFEPELVPLLGRERELAAIRTAFEQARAGSNQVVLIEGEAGVGKSHLARSSLDWMGSRGVEVLVGRAFETGRGLPYGALVEALRGRLEHENAPEDLVDDVWLAELAMLLPELRTRYPDLPDAFRDERLQRVRLFEAVARLGQALAERGPFVLFIDDAQWADVDTRHVLSYSVRRWRHAGVPALVVLAVRSEDVGTRRGLARWLAGLEREAPVIRLPLGPLAAVDVIRWIGALTGAADDRPNVVGTNVSVFGRWLAERTGGRPSYIVQMLRMLLDEGVLGLRPAAGDSWVLDVDRALDGRARERLEQMLPIGVRALVRDLLHRVDAASSALLAAAAALDEWFTAETVCGVAHVEELVGLRALEALVRGKVLHKGPDGRYAFRHTLVREAVREEAGEARQRAYHLRALQILEQNDAALTGLRATH